jgi:pimeloyl-ACP methyl ester carboxylesterase
MQRNRWVLTVLGLGTAFLLAGMAAPAGARVNEEARENQDKAAVVGDDKPPEPKSVDIVTVDQVELKGKYFPSTKGKNAPCVLMLHAIGETENSTNKEWYTLARTLQKRGYAVLIFDFRGHGESKIVKPGTPNPNPQLAVKGFWDENFNQKFVKGLVAKKPRPTEINFKDFSPEYYTFLCNDIAAAKAFLDDRNDAGECNSGNLILIGAKDGATLGALWLNSECQRHRFVPDGFGQGQLDKDAEANA